MRVRMRVLSALAALFGTGVGLAGCGGGERAEVEGGRVLALAASSLQFALPELAAEFERRTGTGVDIVLGSSGNLVAQIESGAPADVFLSADRSFVQRLDGAGRTASGTSRDYATGRVALVAPPGRPAPPSVASLADSAYQVVAIANPATAPYGRAAREVLEGAGVWPAIESRVVYSENIAQASQFARTGNADAAILAMSVVLEVEGWEYTPIAPGSHAPIVQAGTVIADGPNATAGRAFLDFVASPAGVEILGRHGFGPPGG